MEQLQANLSEGKKFTKIDLPHSIINRCLRQRADLGYKRLTYEVSSAVSNFQRTIENVL